MSRARESTDGSQTFWAIRISSRAGEFALLATTESRYNPLSYHNGSIWPHDNSIIANGMAEDMGARKRLGRCC